MPENDEGRLKAFAFHVEKNRASDGRTGYYRIDEVHRMDTGADSAITIRVNSVLKKHFEDLCKKDHSSMSREIKRYMNAAVRAQRLI